MARRSLVEMVELTARVPRGHDGFWQIIGQVDGKGPWTTRQIADATNVDRSSVKDYVRRLELGGFIGRVGQCPPKSGPKQAILYRLLKKPIDAPRLDRRGKELAEPNRQLLWRAMRILKVFTCRDLQEAAQLPGRPIALTTAQLYVYALANVGVLVSPQGRGPHVTYHLVRDLGPKHPSVSTSEIVFDPNSRTVIGAPTIKVCP